MKRLWCRFKSWFGRKGLLWYELSVGREPGEVLKEIEHWKYKFIDCNDERIKVRKALEQREADLVYARRKLSVDELVVMFSVSAGKMLTRREVADLIFPSSMMTVCDVKDFITEHFPHIGKPGTIICPQFEPTWGDCPEDVAIEGELDKTSTLPDEVQQVIIERENKEKDPNESTST